jgi:hypothetical protein
MMIYFLTTPEIKEMKRCVEVLTCMHSFMSTAMRTTLCVRSAYDDAARPLDAFRGRAYAK